MSDIFDESVLATLREMEAEAGEDIVGEILEDFVREVPAEVKKLKSYLNESSFEKIAQVAHTLKSSSANVGAMALSKVSGEIEDQIVNKKNYDGIEDLVDQIEKILELTLVSLKAA